MRYGLLLLLAGLNTACSQHFPVQLGDKIVDVVQIKNGRGKNFIHVHQNETTALQAAKKTIQTKGGSIITLVHDGERNIVFHLHEKRYEFDPNRIFTDTGIKKTLAEFGPYDKAAHHEVNKLAEQIKTILPPGKIIAVHNNDTYSLKNYFPGADMAHDAAALNYNPEYYYRNFYLVTKKDDYIRLKSLKFNSILQAITATDDGSLSVYLAERDYINVEAGYDQLAQQINMLNHA